MVICYPTYLGVGHVVGIRVLSPNLMRRRRPMWMDGGRSKRVLEGLDDIPRRRRALHHVRRGRRIARIHRHRAMVPRRHHGLGWHRIGILPRG